MAPQNLVGKAYAFAADEHPRAGNEANSTLTLRLPAEGALRPVPLDLVALPSAAEDHPAATRSFSLSFSLSFSTTPGLIAVRMMSSINPYSLAASAVRK